LARDGIGIEKFGSGKDLAQTIAESALARRNASGDSNCGHFRSNATSFSSPAFAPGNIVREIPSLRTGSRKSMSNPSGTSNNYRACMAEDHYTKDN